MNDKKLEIEISKTFMNAKVREFDERIGDGMVGRLTKELNEIKTKRDTEILEITQKIIEKYEAEIASINKKIYSKAKLLEK